MIEAITYCIVGMLRLYLIFALGYTLKSRNKILAIPLFIYGFIYDIWLNWCISFLFLDTPKVWDETITNRMKRYKSVRDGSYRYLFAIWLCKQLDRFDKGHC